MSPMFHPARGRDLSCPANPECTKALVIWRNVPDPSSEVEPEWWLGCPEHGGIRTVAELGQPGEVYTIASQTPGGGE